MDRDCVENVLVLGSFKRYFPLVVPMQPENKVYDGEVVVG
jgi:hypothetical protein